jgi:hypothetical protein
VKDRPQIERHIKPSQTTALLPEVHPSPFTHMKTALSRRHFLQTTAAASLGLAALGRSRARAASPNGKLRVLSIGVVGTIGSLDRKQVAGHPEVEIAGLCDVDSNYLAQAAAEHPQAFTCRDYREAFAKHGDKFYAVIVSVPDHSHAPILLTAMAHHKHVYGQKPLVHQLEELVMVERALKARPQLVTQLGNQRMANIFSYDELMSPVSVKTDCAEPAGKHFHVNPCKSTVVYQVGSDKFSGKTFPIHYSDSGQQATAAQLRIPEPVTDSSMTAVVCEGGTMVLAPEGGMKIWRDGKATAGLRLPGLPAFPPLNHWHAWVDNCLGKKTELRTPFKDAVRITEAMLLAVKATRFPGQELRWDKSKLAFTNHPEAPIPLSVANTATDLPRHPWHDHDSPIINNYAN